MTTTVEAKDLSEKLQDPQWLIKQKEIYVPGEKKTSNEYFDSIVFSGMSRAARGANKIAKTISPMVRERNELYRSKEANTRRAIGLAIKDSKRLITRINSVSRTGKCSCGWVPRDPAKIENIVVSTRGKCPHCNIRVSSVCKGDGNHSCSQCGNAM